MRRFRIAPGSQGSVPGGAALEPLRRRSCADGCPWRVSGQQRGGELFVKAEEVFDALAVGVERSRPCAKPSKRKSPVSWPPNLLFMDESGVNRAMTRTHARRLRGTRALGSAPHHWSDNVSILGALTRRGTLEARCVHGATNGAGFLADLEHCLGSVHNWLEGC